MLFLESGISILSQTLSSGMTHYYTISMPCFVLVDLLALSEARDTQIDVLAPMCGTLNANGMSDVLVA